MGSAFTAHEAITGEMDRLRSEMDAAKKLIDGVLMKELLAARIENVKLKEMLSIYEGKLAQAMQGIPSSDYSN